MKSNSNRPTNPQRSSRSANSESPEPRAELRPPPTWLIILFGILFYWAQIYVDQHAGEFHPKVYEPYKTFKEVADLQPKDETALIVAKGKVAYDAACKLCHQDSGLGAPSQFPPLAGSEWVQGSPERLIRIPIHGLTGDITVKGQKWSGVSMPAIGAGLSPEELAALLTYIRQAWGNNAPPIKPEQVKAVFEKEASRSQQWTEQELLQLQGP